MARYEDITIDQGADVAIELHLATANGAAKNLTNHVISSKIKKTYNSDSSDTTSFNAIIANPASRGIVTLSLTNTETDNLKAGRYVYDVEMALVDSAGISIIERILEGQLIVTPSVTR